MAESVIKTTRDTCEAAIKDDRFVALLIDETTDSALIAQLVVHYRTVHRGVLTQRFGTMLPLSEAQTGIAIRNIITKHMHGKTE